MSRAQTITIKALTTTALIALIYLVSPTVAGGVGAALLKFNNTSFSVSNGQTISVEVVVDAAGEKITSMDGYVTYDSSLLQATSVTDGTFFPTVFNDINTSRVYVAGLVDDPATYKENSGTVATITFKALKDGTGTLAYKCQAGASDSSKVIKNDFNATNIIDCAQNGTATVTVGAATGPTETPAATTETVTPTPSQLPESGVMDSLVGFASAGVVLIVLGFAIQILLL